MFLDGLDNQTSMLASENLNKIGQLYAPFVMESHVFFQKFYFKPYTGSFSLKKIIQYTKHLIQWHFQLAYVTNRRGDVVLGGGDTTAPS